MNLTLVAKQKMNNLTLLPYPIKYLELNKIIRLKILDK